ncbi:stromal 70 kDa heat shock-related protein, chloroplastic-like [Quercus suber]|uniref:stromal 70 kDa heat shock-related protein, chloroplastic-like n=1 Tax=Quercus suber TaxID=58331 RepID=UPI0032E04875
MLFFQLQFGSSIYSVVKGFTYIAALASAPQLKLLVSDCCGLLCIKSAVLEVGDGVFEVLSTSGDTHLGGDDFDKRIVDWLAQNFKRDEGINLLEDKQALRRLTETAEKAKMELSSVFQTSISLTFITATADGPKHIDTTLTMVKFEELCSDLLDRL